ncbi:MAG: CPBP family intramembrane metalloprotease, partial [Planctomycetes bacterium]|nr:CPBP family intramembrane metalloprotease [Planctomycetota bacterium]
FGLAHSITPLYALLASLLGLYLGIIFIALGTENLIAPIVAHSLYDFVAFLVVRRDYQNRIKNSIDETMLDGQ